MTTNQSSSRKFGGWLAFAVTVGIAASLVPAGQAQPTAPAADTAAPAAAPAPAPTPTADNGEVQKMEVVTVTGSNIPNASEAMAVPVAVLTPDQIQNSGVNTNVLDILRKISPSINGIGGENATLATSNTFGGAIVQIHNLPTLVLINGQRMAYDPADAAGGQEFVDLNSIPVSAIERIEVLSDGSSAIYGSDAVGGVINVILKQDYNGWQANTHYGISDNTGHYTERSGSVVGGVSDGKTSITISLEYAQNDPILESTRNYTNPFYGTTYIPGIVEIFGLSPTSTYDEAFQLNPGHNAPPGGGTYTMAQLVAMGVYTDLGSFNSPGVVAKVQSELNLAQHETLADSLKRQAATFDFDHKIYEDKLHFYGDLLYSHVVTQSELNAQPLFPYISDTNSDLGVYGVTPPAPGTEYVPVTAPTNPLSQASLDQGYTDGSGGDGVLVHNRFIPYPRIFNNDTDNLRVEGGFKGQINEDWSWQAVADISRIDLHYTNPDLLDTNNLIAAFADGTVNPFAITQAPGALDGIVGTGFVNFISTLNNFDATVNGALFELPAGKVDIALGGEFMREGLTAVPDNNTANGLWIDSPTILPFDANRQVDSLYGEVEVPIVAHAQGVPGIYSLAVDYAMRYDNYKNIGTSTVPKVDLKYQPFDDELTLRGSAGKSFIAPTLYDLYGPVTTGSSNVISYTGANGVSYTEVQFQGVTGSNPALQPSKATTWSVGFVYSPKAIKNLTLTSDFYEIVEHGVVGEVNQGTVVQSVEDLGAASPYAKDVHFGSATGPTPSTDTPGQISSKPLATVYLVTPDLNLGADAAKFFDTSLDYVIKTDSFGKFDLGVSATIYNSFLIQEIPSENYYQYAGTVSTNGAIVVGVGGTIPRWKTYTSLEWSLHGFDAVVGQTFIPHVYDIGTGGSSESAPLHVPSYDQYDFALGYDFGRAKVGGQFLQGLSIRIGVNNAFDYMPPVAPYDLQESLADVGSYNGAVGRLWFADLEYKF